MTFPTIWQLSLAGNPEPKGSMVCVGRRGARGHVVVESDPSGAKKAWRKQVTDAARTLAAAIPDAPLAGPLACATLLLLRQPSTNRDLAPIRRNTGDVDKLQRAIFDCLTDAGVIADDSHIVAGPALKAWAGSRTPGAVVLLSQSSSRATFNRMLDRLYHLAPTLDDEETLL